MVLGFSRHQFARVVFDRRSETWFRLHVLAFMFFGGLPATIVYDYVSGNVVGLMRPPPSCSRALRMRPGAGCEPAHRPHNFGPPIKNLLSAPPRAGAGLPGKEAQLRRALRKGNARLKPTQRENDLGERGRFAFGRRNTPYKQPNLAKSPDAPCVSAAAEGSRTLWARPGPGPTCSRCLPAEVTFACTGFGSARPAGRKTSRRHPT